MKAVFFGDLLLRLNPPGYQRFVQVNEFCYTYTGAEANVAVALSNFGMETSFVTKVPTHEIGQASLNYLKQYGVGVDNVVRGGERLGVFYLEKGASQRGGNVIYDRANSAFTQAKREEFDWDIIFRDATWFHITGITPALSDELVEISLDALKKAKERGITVSMDLNYRSKLWTKEKAMETYAKLLPYVDYCKDLFGFHEGAVDVEKIAKWMIDEFGLKGVAVTFRKAKSANDHDFSAFFITDGEIYPSKEYSMHLVDRVGGGDSFSAGWVYALMNGYSPQETIDFAVATSCLKHSVEGDFSLVTLEEVKSLINGDASGRVQR